MNTCGRSVFNPKSKIGKFVCVEKHTIIDRWTVFSYRGEILGAVYRYGPWKEYVFSPVNGTIYSTGCMDDISMFLKRINRGEA